MAQSIDPKIAGWQTEEHELGMIVFSPSESAADQFPYYELPANATFLGLLEADALCLMDDGAVVVYDHEVPGRLFCQAARSQPAFLAALAALQEHFERCVADQSYCNDESAAVAVRERCTEIAGGEDYAGFYVSMLGV